MRSDPYFSLFRKERFRLKEGIAQITQWTHNPFLLQVVVCSFVYGESKAKTKEVSTSKDENGEGEHDGNKLATPSTAPPSQNYAQFTRGMWPSDL